MTLEWRDINLTITSWAKWAGVRVLVLVPAVALETGYHVSRLGMNIFDVARKGYYKLVEVYDLIPYQGVPNPVIEAKVTPLLEPKSIVPLTDIIAAIESKQLMIIGGMGSGKSTVAQYLAYSIGGRVTVYECEGTPDDWKGLQVIGKGENFGAINASMQNDLEDLTSQIQIRTEKGDAGLTGTERVLIAEEFPELVQKCDAAIEWIDRHGRRGRKAKRFLVLLSQFDRVAAWGLEGKGDLADNFLKLRLGKFAVSHAKSLRCPELIEWLRSDRSRAMLDDDPIQLPSYREMKAVTQRLYNPVLSEVGTSTEPEVSPKMGDPDLALWRAVSAVLDSRGESYVVKEVLGYKGTSYQAGKQYLAKLRQRFDPSSINPDIPEQS